MAITDGVIKDLQSEIILLRNEIKELRNMIIPTIELSEEELKELDLIQNEMEKGDYINLDELDIDV